MRVHPKPSPALASTREDCQGDGGERSGGGVGHFLEEGLRAVEVLTKAAEIASNPGKVARLMKDIGHNGQVNSEEFRPVFEALLAVAAEAFV